MNEEQQDNLRAIRQLLQAIDERIFNAAINNKPLTSGVRAEIKLRLGYIADRL